MRNLVTILAGLVSGAVFAQEMPVSNELWVNAGAFSRHFARDKGYNERNGGLGLEFRFTEDWAITAGHYENSVRKPTRYAAVMYQPFRVGDVRVGVSGGLMNGYPNMANGAEFFAAIPMASYERGRFGVNVGLIPTVGKVDGAVVLQLKMRVF